MKSIIDNIKYINKHIEEYMIEVLLTIIALGTAIATYYYIFYEPKKEFMNNINAMVTKIDNIAKEMGGDKNSKQEKFSSLEDKLNSLHHALNNNEIFPENINYNQSSSSYSIEFNTNYRNFLSFLSEIETFAKVKTLSINTKDLNIETPNCSIKIDIQLKQEVSKSGESNLYALKSIELFKPVIFKNQSSKSSWNWKYSITNITLNDKEYSCEIDGKVYYKGKTFKDTDDTTHKVIEITSNRVDLEKDSNKSIVHFIEWKK